MSGNAKSLELLSRYRVTRMEPSHLAEVLSIERESYSSPWPADAFVHEIETNPVGRPIVALSKPTPAQVCAYAVTWVVFENLHVQNLTVHSEHRRQGLAKLLLSRAFEEAVSRKASVALLEVRRSNVAAQSLYRSLGFEEEGIRASYYSRPVEDALLLRKELER